MQQIPAAFAALAQYKQFIIWIPVPKPNGDIDKVPINPATGLAHSAHDPNIWLTTDLALAWAAHNSNYHIGFAFTKADPFWFLDIDKCLHNGQWSPLAISLGAMFAGCAIEVSQSGTGLHIFGTGVPPKHGCKNTAEGLEFYTENRFVALTGNFASGDSGHAPPQFTLDTVVQCYFPPSAVNTSDFDWTNEPVPEYTGPEDDDELIRRMLASKSAASIFGGKASVQALWDADEQILGAVYPSITGQPFDWSSADTALLSHLAFWTGKNCERMDIIFRQSALNRHKWESREDYRYSSMALAVNGCNAVYTKPKPTPPTPPMPPVPTPNTNERATPNTNTDTHISLKPQLKTGLQFMSIEQQIDYFKGCCYVAESNTVFIPNGTFLKPSAFKTCYGGYIFALDSGNEKTTTNAFEAFTESQVINWRIADATIFRPEIPSCSIIEDEGLKLLNTYVPIETKRIKGDPSPFLNLVYKLFPIKSDRNIILAYMAALVQNPGIKFHWTPLIQGMEGNGKSFLMTAVSYAVGMRYTHKPQASDIDNHFNAWVRNKLFIAIEEIYVSNNQEKIDAIKIIITDERIGITSKGVDQITGDNRANVMCSSNRKDAARKTETDRRWCVFYTPQQFAGDLERDGLTELYFYNLFDWAKTKNGWAIITDFLKSYVVPDALNPATLCQTAPKTSSTPEAMHASMSTDELEIVEAVAEGRAGFNGGWISSIALGRLFESKRRKVPKNKWKTILHELGYMVHPNLKDGRANTATQIDGARPRLYIKIGHIHTNLIQPNEILKHYVEAQLQVSTDAKAQQVFNS